jgi:hypothetical protein
MKRAVSLLGLVAAIGILGGSAAQAKVLHVTGQQTTITPSAKATQFLTAHHVTVTALGPATLSNGALTLPIKRGVVGTRKLNGLLVHKGGVKFTVGTRSVALRSFVLARAGHHTALTALVRGHRWIIAQVRHFKVTNSGNQATVTGELLLTSRAARGINRAFKKHVVSPGADIGSLSSTITFS